MDRRSWLWKRKSSDKSPGESDSSGSASSHSEPYFDDQVLLNTLNSFFLNLCMLEIMGSNNAGTYFQFKDHDLGFGQVFFSDL